MEVVQAMRGRWSPREYVPEAVDLKTVYQIFDDARWAQSSNNEQPWRYLLAPLGGKARPQVEALLARGNAYAKQAGILGIAFAKKTFSHDGSPNRTYQHDLGAASQQVALAARAHGLMTRFMAGFDVEKARAFCPDDYDPVAMFVIGSVPSGLPMSERKRNSVEEFVFVDRFGESLTQS